MHANRASETYDCGFRTLLGDLRHPRLQGPSALPAFSLTFWAARSALDLLANASPDEATISPLPALRPTPLAGSVLVHLELHVDHPPRRVGLGIRELADYGELDRSAVSGCP